MDRDAKPATPSVAETGRRRVGRPSTLESGGASLAAILALIRSRAATTRLDIERHAELGRAVVADRLATLERLGLIAEGELGPAIGGRAPRNMRFCVDAGAILAAHVDRASLAVGLADLDGNLIVEHHEAADLALGPEADPRPSDDAVHLASRRAGRERARVVDRDRAAGIALLDANEGDVFSIAALGVLKSMAQLRFLD